MSWGNKGSEDDQVLRGFLSEDQLAEAVSLVPNPTHRCSSPTLFFLPQQALSVYTAIMEETPPRHQTSYKVGFKTRFLPLLVRIKSGSEVSKLAKRGSFQIRQAGVVPNSMALFICCSKLLLCWVERKCRGRGWLRVPTANNVCFPRYALIPRHESSISKTKCYDVRIQIQTPGPKPTEFNDKKLVIRVLQRMTLVCELTFDLYLNFVYKKRVVCSWKMEQEEEERGLLFIQDQRLDIHVSWVSEFVCFENKIEVIHHSNLIIFWLS